MMHNERIRQMGLKVTLPRLKILELLEQHVGQHLSAEDVYKFLLESHAEIGLATIYRVLTQFEEVGLVKRHHFEGGQSIFELNTGPHHDHIVCLECGKVVEFMDELIEERQQTIAAQQGFELRRHALILYGHCQKADCPNKK